MNTVILTGRLTKDPETKTKNDLKITRYTLAVDRRKDETDFINCVCFGKSAEFAEKYLKKGTKILVDGSLRTGSYEGKNGKVYTVDVCVNSHEFLEKKQTPKVNFDGFTDDEELPFG